MVKNYKINQLYNYTIINNLGMSEFMVQAEFPNELTKLFFSLIPAQRKAVKRLFDKRQIQTYAMAFDKAKLWITINAYDITEAYEILAELPLIQFMKVNLYELTYNEQYSNKIPKLSLN